MHILDMIKLGGLIFKGKKFRGFCGQSLNLENKYPLNFILAIIVKKLEIFSYTTRSTHGGNTLRDKASVFTISLPKR